ncbi:MAG: ribose-phosphate diphosphokinase [Deltaproteobacteria bacterium]|nr:ribose-phosphate diphosphokinase [Deltaproteobacteria bacterium]
MSFGKQLASRLSASCAHVAVHKFPDGESLVRVLPVLDSHPIVVRSLHDPNSKVLEILFAADALRRAGAKRLTLVAPYLPYMRQDTVFRHGEPVSQHVFARLLASWFDRVLTIEAHLHRTHRLSDIMPGRSLSTVKEIAAWIRRHADDCFVVGPDSESGPRVRAIAKHAGVPYIVGQKKRLGDRRVRIALPALPQRGRAVLVDDIASSGATLAEATHALRKRGIGRIEAVVVHALFAADAIKRIERAGATRVLSCDTIAHPTNAISLAPVVAAALNRGRG